VNEKTDKQIKANQKTRKGKKNEKPSYNFSSSLKIIAKNCYEKIGNNKQHEPIEVDNDEVIKEIYQILKRVFSL
jgi:hypothetical protein